VLDFLGVVVLVLIMYSPVIVIGLKLDVLQEEYRRLRADVESLKQEAPSE